MFKFFNSSLIKKYAMAISGLFLILFLFQHFTINLTSVFSEKIFNSISHFMGNNPIVQFILQPILIFGVVFHFVMGMVLDYQNRNSRSVKYYLVKGSSNSSWMSRNMILSGVVVLLFLFLHFYDFWVPEMNYKYIEFLPDDPNRYYHELVEKFEMPWRVIFYCVSFVLLAMHLLHGFSSALKSMGTNKSYASSIKTFSYIYSIGIPLGFCFIAIFHHLTH